MSSAIVCSGLVRHLGQRLVLDGFDLAAAPGQVLGLLGPSGSGKTTALRLIAGFDRPDAGVVEVGGVRVADDSTFIPPERRRVGMVFQDFALFPHLTVGGNVGFGLPRGERRRIGEVLEMVGMSGMEGRMPHELSGGEQQRVALARALAPAPQAMLLDEPFSNLDAPQRERIRREVRTILVEARTTAVFVTHDQAEALAVSDTLAVMRQGRVVQAGTPDGIYRRPADRWIAGFLGEGSFLPGSVRDGIVVTPVGRFPTDHPDGSSVDVLIRPEQVRLTPDPSGTGLVVAHEYFGHDQLVTVHSGDGGPLLARTGPLPIFRSGDRVRLEVTGVVVLQDVG